MLKITIPAVELFDGKDKFIQIKEQTLQLEHSLVSLSKWESKWHRPFLSDTPFTREEYIDYIRCMTLTQNVDLNVYQGITPQIFDEVSKYINEPMTATTFPKNGRRGGRREIVTAEIIYYWMLCNNIPFECQKWHLNRLLTLINVCSAKSQKPQKMSTSEVMAQNRALNAARKRKWNTKG